MVRLQSLEHFVVCYIVIKDLIKSPAKKLGKSHARDKKLRHSPPPPLPLRNEKGTGAEMRRAIVSGIVTGDVSVSYWPICFPFLS